MATPERPAVDVELKERAINEAPIGITISDPDRPDNPLIYVNEAFERVTGYSAAESLGRNCRFLQGEETDPDAVTRLREAIEAAEPVTVELLNYRRTGEAFWNEVTVAPLRDASGDVTHFVGFQVDVTQRKEAQLALAEERERLDRVVDRINGLLADVTELLMQGVDRTATEQSIVERIAATESYVGAWFGEPDLAREVLETSSVAGFDGSLDDLALPLQGDGPIAQAYQDRRVVLGPPTDLSGFETDRETGQVAAVPLAYGDANYGVLAVLGAGAGAVDDRELVVLESVGRTIATGINAAQSRLGLTADDIVELEFSLADASFFPVALAEAWDCRIDHRGSAAGSAEGLRLFVDVTGATATDVDATPAVDEIQAITRLGGGESALVELQLIPGSVIDRLAERGAEVRALTAEAGVAELEVAVPAETGGRVILELLEERYDGVELLAYRERDGRPRTRSAFVDDLEERLTERQATALRSAYYGGYYDDPRKVSGDELAAAMEVSRPTFHQHLRAAERKLLAAVFG